MGLLDLNLAANIAGRIFFPRRYGFGGIEFDIVLNEEHFSDTQITRYPVELGMAVTDNIVRQPKRLVIDGLVSSPSSNEFLDWGIQGLAKQATDALLKRPFTSKPTDAWEALLLLQESGERVEVQTGLKLYKNMVIASLSTRQDKESSEHLRFTAVMQEVILVSSTEVDAGILGALQQREGSRSDTASTNAPTADRGAPIVKEGKAVTVAPPSTSVLKSIINRF